MRRAFVLEFTNYLLNQFNTSGQVHTKVNKWPFNTFPLVFFLFKYKHVVVKELLQFFVCKVNTQLFESVELKRQKANTTITQEKGKDTVPFYGQQRNIRTVSNYNTRKSWKRKHHRRFGASRINIHYNIDPNFCSVLAELPSQLTQCKQLNPFQNQWIPNRYPPFCILLVPVRTCDD